MFGGFGFGQGFFGQGTQGGVLVDVEESGALATVGDAVVTAMTSIGDQAVTVVAVSDAVVVA